MPHTVYVDAKMKPYISLQYIIARVPPLTNLPAGTQKKFYKKKDTPGRASVRTRGRDDGNEETEPDAKRPRKSSGAKPKAKSASKANKKK